MSNKSRGRAALLVRTASIAFGIAAIAVATQAGAKSHRSTQPAPAPTNSGPSAQSAAGPSAPQATPQEASTGVPAKQAEQIVVTGFVNSGATSATKLPVSVMDTPFSVDAYNQKFLKAIDVEQVADLYRYMTGIQRAGNTGYDINFRGFKTSGNDRNAILVDGLPGLTVRFGSPPTAGTDHVELVKGATSVLYGKAQPGGFINIITKKPLFSPSYAFEFRGSSGLGPFHRRLGATIDFDATGPVDSAGKLAFRVIGETGYTRGFRRYSYEYPVFLAPSIRWKIDERTQLTLEAEYRRDKSHEDTYLVAPNRDARLIAKIDTTYQEPNDYLLEKGLTESAFLEHEFSRNVKLNVSYRHVYHYDTQKNFDVVGFDPKNPLTTITRRARGQINKRTYNFGDANISAKFNTFGIHHTLLVGVGGGEETAGLDRTQFYNCTGKCTVLNLNIYNPVLGVVPPLTSFPLFNKPSDLTWRYTTDSSFAPYASDLLDLGVVKFMAGGRYTVDRQSIQDLRTPMGITHKRDSKFLPLAGVIVRPVKELSLYASYSTSYVPQTPSVQDVFGLNPFVPTFAKSYEGGFKAELYRHHLMLTGAVFDIEKEGVLDTFNCPTLAQLNAGIANGTYKLPANAPRDASGNLIPATGTCSEQIGAERSRGFELEVNATPLPGWTITGGYAHTIARITKSNLAYQIGAREQDSPDDAVNLWSRYDFLEGPLTNLGFGVGISYVGKRAGLLPTQFNDPRPENGTLPLHAYTTVDAGIYYKASRNLDMNFKVTNLFDKRYIESAGFSGDIQLFPGEPR